MHNKCNVLEPSQTIHFTRPQFVEKSSFRETGPWCQNRLGTIALGGFLFLKTMLKILMENRQAEHTPDIAVGQSLVFAAFYSSEFLH